MKESDYIAATNIAKVRAAKDIIASLRPDGKAISGPEISFIDRALDTWEARLEHQVSSEARQENKEPWRLEWPK